MAKKKPKAADKKPTKEKRLDFVARLPCKFGKSVTAAGTEQCSMSFSVGREESGLTLASAEELFCGRHLEIEMVLGKLSEVQQKSLPGIDAPEFISTDVIIKDFKTGPMKFSSSMKFVEHGLSCERLRPFAGKDVIVTIYQVATAGADDLKDDDDPEEDETKDDIAE